MSVLPLGRADILNEALDFAKEKKTEPTHLNSEYLDWILSRIEEFNAKPKIPHIYMSAARSRSFRNRALTASRASLSLNNFRILPNGCAKVPSQPVGTNARCGGHIYLSATTSLLHHLYQKAFHVGRRP
jgi:hypothetical protein